MLSLIPTQPLRVTHRTGSLKTKSRAVNRCVPVLAAANVEQAVSARDAIRSVLHDKHSHPIFIRLAWHDSGSYDASITAPWPAAGGATASILFKPELGYGANNGLDIAINLLKPIKDTHPDVGWADLIQLASATAIEDAGGPHIPLRLGRKDATGPKDCTPDGRLPAAAGPFQDGSPAPGDHIRKVFIRMGLTDQDIVALSGAHTVGRAHPERSGFGKASTKYTANGPGAPGGSSWTVEWLKFDNSYFADIKNPVDPELLVLPTDAALFEDPGFKPFAEKYAASQDAFFTDYVVSHLKLSELGSGWDGEPVTIPK